MVTVVLCSSGAAPADPGALVPTSPRSCHSTSATSINSQDTVLQAGAAWGGACGLQSWQPRHQLWSWGRI